MDYIREINDILKNHKGHFGISIYDVLGQKQLFSSYAGDKFHLASVIKMLLLFIVLYDVQKEKISLDEKINLKYMDRAIGSFFSKFEQTDTENRYITIKELLGFMIELSDSSIADYFIKRIGFDEIADFFSEHQMYQTKLNVTILQLNLLSYGFEKQTFAQVELWSQLNKFLKDNYEKLKEYDYVKRMKEFQYIDYNYSTPQDLTKILTLLLRGELLNSDLTNIAISILKRQRAHNRIPFMLTPNLAYNIGHQIGTIIDNNKYLVSNDCGFLSTRDKKRILIFTCDRFIEEGYEIDLMIAKISSLICVN